MTPIVITVLVLLVILALIIASRPATFSVHRSQRIAAPPERVFGQVADFRLWTAWSPWEGIDPKATRTYSASTVGVGATYHWNGNSQVGEGLMTFTEVRPNIHLAIDIQFFRPFKAKNRVLFDFTPTTDGTTVTWTMHGNNTFLGKAMSLIFNCEKMIGGPFEKGLSQLKTLCETAA